MIYLAYLAAATATALTALGALHFDPQVEHPWRAIVAGTVAGLLTFAAFLVGGLL